MKFYYTFKKKYLKTLKIIKKLYFYIQILYGKKNQFLIGFALETENEIENAKLKIHKKNKTNGIKQFKSEKNR